MYTVYALIPLHGTHLAKANFSLRFAPRNCSARLNAQHSLNIFVARLNFPFRWLSSVYQRGRVAIKTTASLRHDALIVRSYLVSRGVSLSLLFLVSKRVYIISQRV